ncbi:hypothetical protein WOLCODRAFT_167382 [Wolfiporia cocos MD-104 SS10]|uniref:PB1 domain-containing protein n=1 Tax=Wolfiporia cocos (strain MD-104) TaxID=742152 RepID=A0A2H3J4T5_WOLCO|nr:hypothetical protein WOLCODRAFT_167382 [Wolfiporia cocos MD-104 SS10]
MSPQVQFKLIRSSDGVIRRLTFATPPSWADLATRVEALFGIPTDAVAVSYMDSDGDEITLNTDDELQEFYRERELPEDALDSEKVVRFNVRDINGPRVPGISSGSRDIASVISALSAAVMAHPELVEGLRNLAQVATGNIQEDESGNADVRETAEESARRRVATVLSGIFNIIGRFTGIPPPPPSPPGLHPHPHPHHHPPPPHPGPLHAPWDFHHHNWPGTEEWVWHHPGRGRRHGLTPAHFHPQPPPHVHPHTPHLPRSRSPPHPPSPPFGERRGSPDTRAHSRDHDHRGKRHSTPSILDFRAAGPGVRHDHHRDSSSPHVDFDFRAPGPAARHRGHKHRRSHPGTPPPDGSPAPGPGGEGARVPSPPAPPSPRLLPPQPMPFDHISGYKHGHGDSSHGGWYVPPPPPGWGNAVGGWQFMARDAKESGTDGETKAD